MCSDLCGILPRHLAALLCLLVLVPGTILSLASLQAGISMV